MEIKLELAQDEHISTYHKTKELAISRSSNRFFILNRPMLRYLASWGIRPPMQVTFSVESYQLPDGSVVPQFLFMTVETSKTDKYVKGVRRISKNLFSDSRLTAALPQRKQLIPCVPLMDLHGNVVATKGNDCSFLLDINIKSFKINQQDGESLENCF